MNVINRVTLAGLKQNRTRTIVTIIGVILSAAMITAVTTLIASLQAYLVDFTIADQGNWHAVVHNSDIDDLNALREMDGVTGLAVARSGGYALLPGSQNNYKPYLHVLQLDQAAFATLPVHLLSGRLPVQADEVLVTEHIYTNGGVRYQVGDKLTLKLGQRIGLNGMTLDQRDGFGFRLTEQGGSEQLDVRETRTFTVVGISNRPTSEVESHAAPGYTLYAPLDETVGGSGEFSLYFQATRPARIYTLTNQIRTERQISDSSDLKLNSELLRFLGVSNDKSFQAVLYGLAAILLGLIMVGSVTLIHNSFSISVSERKKQFGLLSGAGATAKQLRHSVFFEALAIGGIGMPLGILAGLAGIGTTIYLLQDALTSLTNMGARVQVPFTLTVPLPAIVAAAALALVTILISAYIPARRTAKMSAMDAIRQTTDIKLTAKQVKTTRLARRVFGLEGDLALKNLKRNRRRYRSTVVSLFISVVLFVSASAFSTYLRDSVSNVYENTDFDFSYYIGSSERLNQSTLKVFDSILARESINAGSIVRTINGQMQVPPEQLPAAYYQAKIDKGIVSSGQSVPIAVDIYSVDSNTFAQYAGSLGLDVTEMQDPNAPAAIVIDKQHYYDYGQKRYLNTSIFSGSVPALLPVTIGGASEVTKLTVGATADQPPLGAPPYATSADEIVIIMDHTVASAVTNNINPPIMYFAAEDTTKADEEIREVLKEAGLPTSQLTNLAEVLRANRNVITIISVFSYGFIVLISLITIANVFNTITTNVNLRRREFAMLRSVGMTERGFRRMLDFECIFYGLKALFYGLPVSVGVTWLIYLSIQQGVEMPFELPLQGILVSTISVFVIVFVSMKYSRDKVRQENILDALRNENL